MYQSILMAYDGSHEGRVALLECADIAPFLQAEFHLLAVMQVQSGLFLAEGFIPENVLQEEKRRYQEILDEGVRILTARGYKAKGHLACGEPVEAICAAAQTLKVDLIVLGHRRRTDFASRWWKGSIGASLLEQAPCNLLIVISKSTTHE